jgi:hypothetical protein
MRAPRLLREGRPAMFRMQGGRVLRDGLPESVRMFSRQGRSADERQSLEGTQDGMQADAAREDVFEQHAESYAHPDWRNGWGDDPGTLVRSLFLSRDVMPD